MVAVSFKKTKLGNEGKTNGWFFRTITSDALQGTAAAKYAIDQGMKILTIIHVNNDFGVNMLAEFKRGSGGLGAVGSTAPFVGLLGTTMGIVNAFQAMSVGGAAGGLAGIGAGIAEALITTAFGLLVAIPAVWAYNYFTTKLEGFDVEMGNSSSELIDYFLKRSQATRGAAK